jgi:hypothetical protein
LTARPRATAAVWRCAAREFDRRDARAFEGCALGGCGGTRRGGIPPLAPGRGYGRS